MLNMFWMLIHPSSGACDLFVELFHGLYWVVSVCRLKPAYGYHTTTAKPQRNKHTSNQSNTTHEITQQISRKLLRMDVLTSKTCWALNKEIIKQVISSWSFFNQQIQFSTVTWLWMFLVFVSSHANRHRHIQMASCYIMILCINKSEQVAKYLKLPGLKNTCMSMMFCVRLFSLACIKTKGGHFKPTIYWTVH